MATNDTRASSLSEFQEIIRRLERIENGDHDVRGQGPQIPFRDPTENVLDALAKDESHRKEIRDIDEAHRQEIRALQARYNDELTKVTDKLELKEKDRLDAINQANTSNTALALSKQETITLAQDRRIATLEQNQYRGGGQQEQEATNRESRQWSTGVIVAASGTVLVFLIELYRIATGH